MQHLLHKYSTSFAAQICKYQQTSVRVDQSDGIPNVSIDSTVSRCKH